MKIRILLFMVTPILTACADNRPKPDHSVGDVSWQVDMQPGAARYVLKPEQAASDIKTLDHDSPSYPATLIHLSLPPRDIHVRVIVDKLGSVSEVRELSPEVDSYGELFFFSIQRTVKDWKYTPLIISDWKIEGDHATKTSSRIVAFSMDYVFHFEIKDGLPLVTGLSEKKLKESE